jgi:hypothetical protein
MGGRYHPQQSVLKPQSAQRQTACMRYTFAPPQRSHTIASGGGAGAGACGWGAEGTAVSSGLDMMAPL